MALFVVDTTCFTSWQRRCRVCRRRLGKSKQVYCSEACRLYQENRVRRAQYRQAKQARTA